MLPITALTSGFFAVVTWKCLGLIVTLLVCLKCAMLPGITPTTVSVHVRCIYTGEKLSHFLLPLRWPVVQSEGSIWTKGMSIHVHLISTI